MQELYKWFCLECKKEIPVDEIDKDKCCPYCECRIFKVEIWGYK